MKKEYTKPATILVKVNMSTTLLAGSGVINNGDDKDKIDNADGGDWAD